LLGCLGPMCLSPPLVLVLVQQCSPLSAPRPFSGLKGFKQPVVAHWGAATIIVKVDVVFLSDAVVFVIQKYAKVGEVLRDAMHGSGDVGTALKVGND
jgi:hypothetical protein